MLSIGFPGDEDPNCAGPVCWKCGEDLITTDDGRSYVCTSDRCTEAVIEKDEETIE